MLRRPFFSAVRENSVCKCTPIQDPSHLHLMQDRHEFRFPQILDWIRQHIKPLR